MSTLPRTREWLSIIGALAVGPVALLFGYSQRLMFGLAAAYIVLIWLAIVPLLTYFGSRLKFFVWQLAVIDIALSVIGDDLRGNMIHGLEIVSVAYVFWGMGTLLSSPLPVFFILRSVPGRRRYFVGLSIAVIAIAMYLGLRHIVR